MAFHRRLGFLASAVALLGCNEILGLEDVSLRVETATTTGTGGIGGIGGDGGVGGIGGSTVSSATGGAGGQGGQGGEAPEPYMCGEIDFDNGVIDEGDFDTAWGGNNFGGGLFDDNPDQCEGAWYYDVGASGGPPAGGYIESTGTPGTLVAKPCLHWRIAVFDPLAASPHFWLLFNIGDLEDGGATINLLSPPEGNVATSVTDWEFIEGTCRVALPNPLTFADVRVYVEGEVYLDAFEGHAVDCEVDTPDCGHTL